MMRSGSRNGVAVMVEYRIVSESATVWHGALDHDVNLVDPWGLNDGSDEAPDPLGVRALLSALCGVATGEGSFQERVHSDYAFMETGPESVPRGPF